MWGKKIEEKVKLSEERSGRGGGVRVAGWEILKLGKVWHEQK
jgi:hypothetical protein